MEQNQGNQILGFVEFGENPGTQETFIRQCPLDGFHKAALHAAFHVGLHCRFSHGISQWSVGDLSVWKKQQRRGGENVQHAIRSGVQNG